MGIEEKLVRPQLYGADIDAPPTVLVLDNDRGILNTIQGGLTRAGYAVKTAKTIDEAVSVMNSYGADIAVIDYRLGKKETGFDAMLSLQRQHWLPIILMSASDETPEGLDLRYQAGVHKARGFVKKGEMGFIDDILKTIERTFSSSTERTFTYQPGTVFESSGEKYTFDAQWRIGGHADVYVATQTNTITGIINDKKFALKVLRAPSNLHGRRVFLSLMAYSWDAYKQYFHLCKKLSEAPTSRNLVHLEGYGRVDTPGDAGPILYFVEEFIKGPNLREYLDEKESGVLPIKEFLEISSQAASGLNRLHKAGLAHRDVVPYNILLENMGSTLPRVVITDFGSVRNIRSHQDPVVMSSFAYIAPEQLMGKPGAIQADRWALGICMYEALTGVRPFQTSSDVELRGKPLPLRQALERDEKLAQSILHDNILPPSEMKRRRVEQGKITGPVAEERIPQKIDNIIMNLLVKGPRRMKLSSVVARIGEVARSFRR